MSDIYVTQRRFRRLFRGLDTAFGTGDKPGRWIKRHPRPEDFLDHLQAKTNGIGIAPLMPDNKVWFAALDHDVVGDFETGFEMQKLIPGRSFVERTRNDKVHVWVFFREPIEAWVARGVLSEVAKGVGFPHTEIFPKNHDFARVKLGNYINLPYHGDKRPIILPGEAGTLPLDEFLDDAEGELNDPHKWHQRAAFLLVQDPAQRETRGDSTPFGEADNLHMCAEYIIANAESNPLREGGRHDTIFALAKQLSHWRLCDHDEALGFLREVNKHALPPIADAEVVRALRNAEEKRYTSTSCDMPNVAPYAHPDCPIAHPRRR